MAFAFFSTLGLLATFQLSGLVAADSQNIDLCGQSDWWNSTEVPYSFNNNAWGNDSSGYQCMAVHDNGRSFSVSYKWTGDASLVKGYPYMKAHPTRLPVQLWNVTQLQVTGNWQTYVAGKEKASAEQQAQAFDDVSLYANVAVDMFLSDNKENSTMVGAPIEIMIWPWWTPTVKPLGWAESTPDKDTVTIDGTPFSLYHGWNDGGQHVFSWLARTNLTKTDADYGPLLSYIWKKGMLSGAMWLGQLELGTEIKHAAGDMHFEASNYTLKVVRQGDPEDKATSTSTTQSSTSQTATTKTTMTTAAAEAATTSAPSPTSTNAASTSCLVDLSTIWWISLATVLLC
ncbi:endoglucanase [Colletotrichum scovillei]|uniref:Glycoside hydrolase family 12 protein n=1 Tax=Colletotrichum scovillei TaxID=1209932 RepID=A0A9P7RH62_9PEZI|nr:endoglucanase [Colletotrichum scovillei]KAF4779762.1 endoglucanase [Colletotrichum scovillei]KAG7058039.1 glycoside hydrolase family 12 protein [Colletotrichum scovillei]KAG7076672.1 glycoside hydrolase family 12 protein [Colletotrichum scovillei]KAG7083778.1 glycoside hydrolase family 12 protein [Colletotrichum scovillei]